MEHEITFEGVARQVTGLFVQKGKTWEETYLQGAAPFKRAVANIVNKALRLEGRVLVRDIDYSDADVKDSLVDMAVWTLMAIHLGELMKRKKKEEQVKEIPLREIP